MKRELFALLLLAGLAALSFWNIRRVDALHAELEEHLALSQKAVLADDAKYAEEQLKAALRIWLSARRFSRVFLPHPELDATSEKFFEALQTLKAGETRSMPAAFGKIRYHLDCISSMQHISLGSVF